MMINLSWEFNIFDFSFRKAWCLLDGIILFACRLMLSFSCRAFSFVFVQEPQVSAWTSWRGNSWSRTPSTSVWPFHVSSPRMSRAPSVSSVLSVRSCLSYTCECVLYIVSTVSLLPDLLLYRLIRNPGGLRDMRTPQLHVQSFCSTYRRKRLQITLYDHDIFRMFIKVHFVEWEIFHAFILFFYVLCMWSGQTKIDLILN